MKAFVVAFFYFMASMTCTWNVVVDCCSGKDHDRHHHAGNSRHSQRGGSSHDEHSKGEKTCCRQLITPLVHSFVLLQKCFLTGFQVFNENYCLSYLKQQKYLSISLRDPPFPIRGRPLYIILFPINAPPIHP